MSTDTPFAIVDAATVQLVLLAMTRVSGMLFLAPPFSNPMIPIHARIGLAFALLLPVWPSLVVAAPPVAPNVLVLVGLVAANLLVGLTIGFIARLMTIAVAAAAELVGIQIGLGLASVLDPAQGSQVTVLTRLFDWTMLALFLALDAHHVVIGAIVESFRIVPLSGGGLPSAAALAIIPLGGRIFALALSLVAPPLDILFLTELILVLAARAVPQVNLLSVGFPITVMLGLAVILLNVDLVSAVAAREMRDLESVLTTVLRSFADGR
jgi:flagellar biosynthesis protein FliR